MAIFCSYQVHGVSIYRLFLFNAPYMFKVFKNIFKYTVIRDIDLKNFQNFEMSMIFFFVSEFFRFHRFVITFSKTPEDLTQECQKNWHPKNIFWSKKYFSRKHSKNFIPARDHQRKPKTRPVRSKTLRVRIAENPGRTQDFRRPVTTFPGSRSFYSDGDCKLCPTVLEGMTA